MGRFSIRDPDQPALASDWVIEEAGSGIFLARSEFGFRVLRCGVLNVLLPLLDGCRTAADLARELSPMTQETLLEALNLLDREGLLAGSRPADIMRAESAYWRLMGADDSVVSRRRGEAACRVIAEGPNNRMPVVDSLSELGVRVGDDAGFRLVVARDYLDERLDAINEECLREGSAWMLVRPYGRRHWIGPLFVPGRTGCWYCLAWWLTINGWSAAAIVAELRPLTTSTLALAGIEAAKWLLTGQGEAIQGRIREFDTTALTFTEHRFLARPGCPRCHAAGGGAVDLHATLSPLTGVSARVERVREWPGLAVYSGETSQKVGFEGTGGAYHCRPQTTVGVAESAEEAEIVCLAEAAERYSVRFQGDERIVAGSRCEFGARCVDRSTLLLASARQLANCGGEVGDADHSLRVHFPADATIGWVECMSLASHESWYIPAGHVYLGYDAAHFRADTNGVAAAPTVHGATLAGLLELIERDAVSLWWYNRVRRPAVELAPLESRRIQAVLAAAQGYGKRVHVLALMTDFGVPVCVAIAYGEAPGIAMGCAAHPDPERCVWKALAEMSAVMARLAMPLEGWTQWLAESRIEEFSHLILSGPPARWDVVSAPATLTSLITRARELGLDVLMADLTRPELGIPVVRVVVPGLRPLARRLAPGRLYDVPVKIGWLERPLSEAEMNPMEFAL